ncbi:MAG: hypothetical protein GYB20_07020 [Oceanospirillales bacterium]|nr:hypothetical protein [Oceanospirillales bacterium]MBR9887431.1 hypothetical protein [Oceanospirillales bacterium]
MEILGLSQFDLALIILCPIGGVIGSFAHAIIDTIDPISSPKDEKQAVFASKELQEKRGAWLGLRCTLGAILGLVLGLYFVGAIQENSATIAKILAFSILAGYAAPKIWAAQDKIVDAKLKKILAGSKEDKT